VKRGPALVAGLAFAALLGAEREADAFCRARTCNANDAKQHCEVVDNCVTSGHLLEWHTSCLSFDAQLDGSPRRGIDAETVADVVARAFAPWLHANCGNGQPPLEVGTFGPVLCDEVENPDPKQPDEYNRSTEKGANVVMFRDEAWPYVGAQDAFGLTTVTYDVDTGEIIDADIELNSHDFNISVDGSGTDLQSILTHEVGHFLGMAHAASADMTATMRANWDGNGTDLRTLTSDDEAGICDAYPPNQKAPSVCAPLNGLASECHVPADKPDGGCALAAGRPAAARAKGPLFAALDLLALCVLRRRRSRRNAELPRRSLDTKALDNGSHRSRDRASSDRRRDLE
jgi:hypothetical protein